MTKLNISLIQFWKLIFSLTLVKNSLLRPLCLYVKSIGITENGRLMRLVLVIQVA